MTSVAHAPAAPMNRLTAVPPLAWMAAVAAVADLTLNGFLIKLGHSSWSVDTLRHMSDTGRFALNLSVVAGLVALGFALGSLASRQSGLPMSARASLAGFGWVLIPIVTLMTILPMALTRKELVLVVAALSHAVIVLLVLAGLHWRSAPALIATMILTLVASLSGLAAMSTTLIGERFFWPQTARLANAFHWSGELAYLAVPIVAAFFLRIPWGTLRGKVALALSAVTAAIVTVEFALLSKTVGPELSTLLYGALKLDLLPERVAILYAIPLGIGWAVTVAAILSKDSSRRQLGAALMLLLSAGYGPRTPSALILTVLAVALLARTSIVAARERSARAPS